MKNQGLNWKNIHNDHPKGKCNICLKVGDNYETFMFKPKGSDSNWELYKYPKTILADKVPEHAEYILLDNEQ